MNEEDGSPGGGAAAHAPAEPPASPAAPAPTAVTVDQVKTLMAETLTGFKNAFFADMRRAGALKKDEPAAPQPAPAAATTTAPAALTATDVQQMLERDRVLTRVEVEHKLTPAQAKRMRSIVEAEKPADVSDWVSNFVTDMGFAKPNTPPEQATQAQAPAPAKPNVSDRGTAAPTDTRDFNGVLNSRPLEMTGHDVDNLMLQHGPDKGLQMFQEHVLRALGKVRIKPPRG